MPDVEIGTGELPTVRRVSVPECADSRVDLWHRPFVMQDGRVVVALADASFILIYNPSDDSCELVADLGESSWTWSSSVVMRDGCVFFAPSYAPSVMLFHPNKYAIENICSFEGEDKWLDCCLLRDCRVLACSGSGHRSLSTPLQPPVDFKRSATLSRCGTNWSSGRVRHE